MSQILLGQTVTDKITGFKGVVTGRCEYISGCDQALVVPPVDDKGKIDDGRWFDVQRLVVDAAAPIVRLDNGDTPGCDAPAPVR
ncbi:MAG: hypothetical protein KGL39_16360 [Patescibacteria group bacterium]|nr:hypothetical protein [Patescibacteria group bacterium]